MPDSRSTTVGSTRSSRATSPRATAWPTTPASWSRARPRRCGPRCSRSACCSRAGSWSGRSCSGVGLYLGGVALTYRLARELGCRPRPGAARRRLDPRHLLARVVGALRHGGAAVHRAVARRHGGRHPRAPRDPSRAAALARAVRRRRPGAPGGRAAAGGGRRGSPARLAPPRCDRRAAPGSPAAAELCSRDWASRRSSSCPRRWCTSRSAARRCPPLSAPRRRPYAACCPTPSTSIWSSGSSSARCRSRRSAPAPGALALVAAPRRTRATWACCRRCGWRRCRSRIPCCRRRANTSWSATSGDTSSRCCRWSRSWARSGWSAPRGASARPRASSAIAPRRSARRRAGACRSAASR